MKTAIRLLVWSLFCLPNLLFSQQTHQVRIEAIPQGTAFRFRVPNPPKLTPFTKNQPYLSYFWDFGDGTFKRGTVNAEEPVHTYAKAGDYTVRALIFTGNTLDLVEQPQSITVHASASGRGESLSQSAALAVIGSHYRDELRPNEDMIAVLSTKGTGRNAGKLYVFFNEKQHKGVRPLEFRKASAYFGEREGADNPSLPDIATAKALFNDVKVFDLLPTDPSVISSLFLTFKQVSNITNKIKNQKVWTYILWVVDGKVADKANLTLNVVPSHDPNDMRVDPDYLSFRGAKKQEFTYRVRFENTDKGIAKSIGVKIFKPQQADTSRIEWLEFSPKCEECPKNKPLAEITFRCYVRSNTAEFSDMYFHNAQLAGKTKGMLDKSLNDGFVTYKLQPVQKGLKKLPLASYAVVTFDGQEQKTNTAKVNFTRGFWFGPKIGVNYDPVAQSSSYFLGAVLSPYKDVDWHLQFEALSDFTIANKNIVKQTTIHLPVPIGTTSAPPSVDSTTISFQNIKQRTINIVPLQLTKDFGNFLSFGGGISTDIYFQTINQTDSIYKIYFNADKIQKISNNRIIRQERQETQFRIAPFGDIALGYEGFRVGMRYTYPLAARRQDYFQLYSYYKF